MRYNLARGDMIGSAAAVAVTVAGTVAVAAERRCVEKTGMSSMVGVGLGDGLGWGLWESGRGVVGYMVAFSLAVMK
jgi:hypothetical protein